MSPEKIEKYKEDFESFFDSKLCFAEEDLWAEHSRLYHLHFNLAQVERQECDRSKAKVKAILAYFIQENKDNLNRCLMLEELELKKCSKKFAEIETILALQLKSNPLDVTYAIQKELETFLGTRTEDHSGKWKGHFSSWYTDRIHEFLADVPKMLLMVRKYNDRMNTQIFVNSLCVLPEVFDAAHASNLNIVKEMDLAYTWKRPQLSEQAFRTIENIRKDFENQNLRIIEEEKQLIDDAIGSAVELYNESMSLRSKGVTLKEHEIEKFNRISSQAIVSIFCEVPTFTYSYLWRLEETRNKLIEMLDRQPVNYIKCSQTNSQAEVAVASPRFSTPTTSANSPKIGVGIYICPSGVRLGMYRGPKSALNYLQFPPCITMEKNELRLSKLQSSSHSSCSFYIYEIILAGKSIRRTVNLSNEVVSLGAEEIIALYLSKVRRETETQSEKVSVRSCVVSVTAFLPPSSKQMLKDSLKLAGFHRSEIIQTTTAIGISYIHSYIHRSNTDKDHYVALIHSNSSQFEVAIAQVLTGPNKALVIKRINNSTHIDEEAKNLFKVILSSLKSVFWNDPSKDELKKSISGMLSTLNLKEDLGASVFVDPERKEDTVLRVDNKGNSKNPVVDSPNTAVHENEGVVLGTTLLDAMNLGMYGHDKPIKYTEIPVHEYGGGLNGGKRNSMTTTDFEISSKKLTFILKLCQEEPMETDATDSLESSSTPADPGVEDPTNNSRTKLAQLVSLVEKRLEGDTLKNATIKSMIQKTLQDCEKALQNPTTKEAQIQVLVKNLELASSAIPTH